MMLKFVRFNVLLFMFQVAQACQIPTFVKPVKETSNNYVGLASTRLNFECQRFMQRRRHEQIMQEMERQHAQEMQERCRRYAHIEQEACDELIWDAHEFEKEGKDLVAQRVLWDRSLRLYPARVGSTWNIFWFDYNTLRRIDDAVSVLEQNSAFVGESNEDLIKRVARASCDFVLLDGSIKFRAERHYLYHNDEASLNQLRMKIDGITEGALRERARRIEESRIRLVEIRARLEESERALQNVNERIARRQNS